MAKLFTKEQARTWLRENNLKTGKSIEDAFISEIKDVLQEALEEEMTSELGYSKYDWKNKKTSNSRNGHTKKTVKSQFGEIPLDIPRDTNGEFEPVIVKKYERTISNSLEDMIVSLFAQGMSNRDIEQHMRKIYGIDVSPGMVTRITDKILPIAKKTAYTVFAITIEGKKEIPGIWIGEAESSKFWMNVLSDLKNRGVKDILISSVDGLSGFEVAIKAAFPKTEIQRW